MPLLAVPKLAQQHLARVERLLAAGGRQLLGLAGPPGAGKSTLALQLQQGLGTCAQVVPMDGFHLSNRELERLGRAGRKGAPDTFDADGFVALLRRLRQQGADEVIYAPEFCRQLEEALAGALPILPQTRLLIVEGNYLLLDEGPWAAVPPLLDEIWYVGVDEGLRRQRLAQRHIEHGRSPQEALDWIASTDDPNAQRIVQTRARADHVFDWAD